jgi:hypothetical protein
VVAVGRRPTFKATRTLSSVQTIRGHAPKPAGPLAAHLRAAESHGSRNRGSQCPTFDAVTRNAVSLLTAPKDQSTSIARQPAGTLSAVDSGATPTTGSAETASGQPSSPDTATTAKSPLTRPVLSCTANVKDSTHGLNGTLRAASAALPSHWTAQTGNIAPMLIGWPTGRTGCQVAKHSQPNR